MTTFQHRRAPEDRSTEPFETLMERIARNDDVTSSESRGVSELSTEAGLSPHTVKETAQRFARKHDQIRDLRDHIRDLRDDEPSRPAA
jgi:hypothetical protein